MSRSVFDRPVGRLARVGAIALSAITLPGLARAQAVPEANPHGIRSSEISVSRREATLRLELNSGKRLDFELRDGTFLSSGRSIGEAPRNSPLDESWRALLGEAIDASTEELTRMLVQWQAPESDLGRRIDAALESALTGEGAPIEAIPEVVAAEAEAEAAEQEAQASDSVNRLLERVNELEELVDELEDTRITVHADPPGGGRGFNWLGPFRHIGRGLAGIVSILVTYAVLFGIAFAAIFFGGRRYIEGVADTARLSTMRSLLVGLAATFLVIPAWILGMIALAISIVGIPALLVWIPLFPVAAAIAVLLGYIGVAHACGEAMAERRFYASDWFQRGNSYYFLLTGLALLMALFIGAQVVSMAGPWLGFFRGALTALAVVITWVALSVGFGAVLLSRGGTRPVRAPGSPDPEIYAEETRV